MKLLHALLPPLALALHATLTHAAALPSGLSTALERGQIPPEAVAVRVERLGSSAPGSPDSLILAHQETVPMNPASVMKLVTAWAALERLGPAYTWKTRYTSPASIHDGVLEGALYITGGGDPRLSRESLWQTVHQLRALGIRRIRGDVVTDRSLFRLPPHDPGAFDQRPLRPYNVGADALMVDYGALTLHFQPQGARVLVQPALLPTGLQLDNRITRSKGRCSDPSAGLQATFTHPEDPKRLVISGQVAEGCTEGFDWNLAPLPHPRLFEGVFRSLWQEAGGQLEGRFREGSSPAEARLLVEQTSPPLPDVLRDMNKWSNNVIARMVLATLGSQNATGTEDSPQAGARQVEQSLRDAGIPTAGFVMENGAGLSRIERISAASLGALLAQAWHGPRMPELMASLAIAGVDGTARRRLADSPSAGRAHVKTGTLDGVRALAGYVLSHKGERYSVVLLVNHPNAGAARDAQDALLEWVAGL
jgi:D-alanyl-D-alanine carboxypeptidase/D-alanyl-D-alanine-endopeptidase (penicillin-binding protein 4)